MVGEVVGRKPRRGERSVLPQQLQTILLKRASDNLCKTNYYDIKDVRRDLIAFRAAYLLSMNYKRSALEISDLLEAVFNPSEYEFRRKEFERDDNR